MEAIGKVVKRIVERAFACSDLTIVEAPPGRRFDDGQEKNGAAAEGEPATAPSWGGDIQDAYPPLGSRPVPVCQGELTATRGISLRRQR